MSSEHGSRRKDQRLRRSIDNVQARIPDITQRTQTYALILEELCALSETPFGFVLEKKLDEQGSEQLQCDFIYQSKVSAEAEPVLSPFALPVSAETRDIYTALNRHRATVLGDASRSLLRRHCDSALNQILIMPLPMGVSTSLALCLVNGNIPYHIDFAKRVWPLLSICASIIRIVENQELLSSQEKRLLLQKDSWRQNFSRLETLSPLGMITLNQEHRILRVNPAAEVIFGHTPQTMLQQAVSQLIPERFQHEHRSQTFNPHALKHEQGDTHYVQGRHGDGSLITLELSVFHFEEYGQPRIMLMLRDSTDLRRAQASHKAELQRFRVLADLSPMGILQTNHLWHTDYVNERWLQIAGLHESDIHGLNWSRILHIDDAESVLSSLHENLSNGVEFTQDCRILRPGNSIIWAQFHARPLYNNDGDICGFLSTLMDNSYYHEAEAKLRELAEQDALTGLANRTVFNDRLHHALQRLERHGALSLLALDLDGFKNINDTLGHDVGDEMLVEVSRRLQSCVREEDTVARLGGDEFLILLEDMQDAMMAASISEKILKTLEKPFQLGNREVFISTSIGICFALGGKRANAKTLLKQADMALYRAKDAGRNNFQYFSPELELASKRKLELGNSLHQAISNMEFEIYFQAQASVPHSNIAGFEALLRWQHPQRGLLPPAEFIHLLEESGLINSVSRWTLHLCMQNLRKWIDQKLVTPDTAMSINISPKQFHDPLLLPSIEGAVRDANLPGANLVVEITETTLLQDQEQTRLALEKIKKLGAKIALDDFGTGYSSLSYLKKYPIDIIKIDRSFIKDLQVDKEDAAIVRAVLALAESLNLEVIAEGVDCDEILTCLKEWECSHYQGYLLNKPMSTSQIETFLANYPNIPNICHLEPSILSNN